MAATTSDELAETMQAVWSDRFTASAMIVEQAIERHELPAGADPTRT